MLLDFSWMAIPALAVLTEQIDAFVAAGITGAAAAAAVTHHCHRFKVRAIRIPYDAVNHSCVNDNPISLRL